MEPGRSFFWRARSFRESRSLLGRALHAVLWQEAILSQLHLSSMLYSKGSSPSPGSTRKRITDCWERKDEEEEFGNIVEGLLGARLILTDPEPTDVNEGVLGIE